MSAMPANFSSVLATILEAVCHLLARLQRIFDIFLVTEGEVKLLELDDTLA